LRLLFAAAIFHVATTAVLFTVGRQAIRPDSFDANGVGVSFASDSDGHREDAATLAEVLWSGGFYEWLTAAYPFHVKLYSICFASFGALLGFNILSAEPLNLFYYLGILVLVYTLGCEIFGWRSALIASMLVALWPTFVLHTTQFLKDPLFIFGMLALILIMMRLLTRFDPWRTALLRGMLGAVCATMLWKSRPDMGPVVIATITLGALLLVIRQFQTRPVQPSNLAGMALLILISAVALVSLPVYRDADNPRVKTAASKELPSNKKPKPIVHGWQLAAIAGIARQRFVEKYAGAGSNIDPYVKLTSTADLIRYLPRAVAIGMFAPFPNMWFETGSSVGLWGRMLAGFETLLTYVVELLAMVTLWRRRDELSVWLLFSVAAMGITALGLVVVNVGALYRLRYLYLILLIIPAAATIEYLLDWSMKARSSNRRPANLEPAT